MKTFEYTIKDPLGLHALPAGKLVKDVQKFKSDVIIAKGDEQADFKKLFNVMGLAIKQNETIKVTFAGEDEKQALELVEAFFNANF